MRTCFRRLSVASLFIASLAAPAFSQAPLGSGFTYQGSLESSGAVVNAVADFEFRLFDALTGGAQVGTTQTANNVGVVDGRFTTALDFGAGAFNGNARFLEIAVRSPAGTDDFVTLAPRQALTAAPYALKVPGIDGHSLDAVDGSPADALFVSHNGWVGVGTTNPSGRLDVRSAFGTYVRVGVGDGNLHMNGLDGWASIVNDTPGPDAQIDFTLNNERHMVVKGGGNVGIGTTQPLRRFTVVDDGLFTARFENSHLAGSVVEFSNSAIGARWELGVAGFQPPAGMLSGSTYFYRQGEVDLTMVMAPNQWVGMGVNNPGFRLDLPNIANADGRGRANQWVTYSSARWKENVQTLDGALDKVTQLRGVSFDWKPEHGGAHDVGFVAEEVGKVVPELVTWEKDGAWAQGLAYDRVTALTVEAIKEQQGQVESLRQANAGLREQVAMQGQEIAELREQLSNLMNQVTAMRDAAETK